MQLTGNSNEDYEMIRRFKIQKVKKEKQKQLEKEGKFVPLEKIEITEEEIENCFLG